MLEDPPFIGDWHRSVKLGSGGFGVVWLWQNSKTKEKIAVKKCHVVISSNAEKQRERWEREVDYMTNKVRHVNIVRGIKVQPESFIVELNNVNPSNMPILIMEYCEGGDLRRMLNFSRHSSGLPESEVRNILQSLKNAIFYLHSMSITHRDIKPENVVIHVAPDGRKTYKLTDLGYAKPIDMRSIEASLVGTVEYIAPELITSEKYSSSVDYWSLGIIGYEIITGFRPFVPHLPLAQWMLRVRDKKSDHIAITESDGGVFIYSNKISPENHLSVEFSRRLVDWFRLAVEWNPKQRGSVFEVKTKSVKFVDGTDNGQEVGSSPQAPVQVLKFFNTLDDILSVKILTLFVLKRNKYLSFELGDHSTIDELLEFIEREENISKEKCHIVVPVENLSMDVVDIGRIKSANELYFDNYFDKPMVFVVEIHGVEDKDSKASIESIQLDVPDTIRCVLVNPEQRLKPHTLRKFACDTLYFVSTENERYKTSLNGWYNYALQLNHEIELCRSDVTKINSLVHGISGALELYEATLADTKQRLEKIGSKIVSPVVDDEQQMTKLKQNIQLMADACDKIVVRYQSVNRRSREISQHEIFAKRNSQDFYDVVNTTKSFEALRKQFSSKQFVDKPHFELFQCAYKCLKRRDTLLLDENYTEMQKTLAHIHIELIEIKKALEKAISPAEKFKRNVFDSNAKLLELIWTTSVEKVTPSPSVTNDCSGNDKIDLSEITKAYADHSMKIKLPASSVNITDQFGNRITCFGEGSDTQQLVDDSEKLRISLDGLMLEMDEEFNKAASYFDK